MKLRVRVHRQTSYRVELLGPDPSLKELTDHIKETVLSSHGLSADTQFSLSLNGSELLSDSGQTLSSCGIVSGDLISVVLSESAAEASATSSAASSSTSSSVSSSTSSSTSSSASSSTSSSASTSASRTAENQNQQTAAVTSSQQQCEDSRGGLDPSLPSWEPMLCSEAEEGQAPLSLELLHHSAHTCSPSDALMVAVHLLMLETGFLPQVGDQSVQVGEVRPGEMPSGWRSPSGVYRLQYSHPLCGSSQSLLVAVCMGPLLVINAALKVNEAVNKVQKLCLDPSSYVTNEWPGESAAAAFRELSKLSRIIKDQLAYPLITAAREALALPVAFGLAALPPELVLRVLRLLDVRSVVRLSSVCRHFYVSTADSTLWRHLIRRDFPERNVRWSRDTDWRELYKSYHESRRELRHRQRRHAPLRFPQHHFIPAPLPLPLPPPLPGIIGGEYDQRPGLPHVLPPRPRYDPIGPLPDLPGRLRPLGGRPADIRRGFI